MNDDKKLKLNDILHLTKNQIENTKIGLNMDWQGRTHFLDWYESDPNDRNTDFTYHSHQGKSRNFTSIGKLYIGSASGKDGILQRWNDYKTSFTGGNKGLKELLENEGEDYFIENFTYTLLEIFPKNVQPARIYARENYWKEVFKTRAFGYNKN